MRHAARQLAKGLHLLGLAELAFDLHFARHVALDGHIVDNSAGSIPHRRDGCFLLVKRAILALVDKMAAPGFPAMEDGPHLAVKFSIMLAAIDRKSTRLNSSHLVI